MRFERWYWLVVFVVLSLFAHALVGYSTKGLGADTGAIAPPRPMEITLEPNLPEKPVAPQPKPAQIVKADPKEAPPKKQATPRPIVIKEPEPPKPAPVVVRMRRPSRPVTIATNRSNRPIQIAANRDVQHIRLNAPQDEQALGTIKRAALPERKGNTAQEDAAKLDNETPAPLGLPEIAKNTPRPTVIPKTRNAFVPNVGGGSFAPDKTLTGKNGAAGPEAPPEDTIFTGGGAGGQNLPKAPAKVGGGGGNSIVSVANPLAKEAVPEDKPGLGPGAGGGAGTGSGGGAGFKTGRGIGTRRDGRDVLATLNSKPGQGIGAGEGSNVGTRAPGGGKGTGSEMPGTGGEGTGYGRGKGVDIGSGSAQGDPDGLARGIPFGDIKGIFNQGKPNGGGGGGGRGGVFGQAPTLRGGGNAPIHIIYLLDTSGSMRDGNKIFKAERALVKAVLELHPTDTFNIMNFDIRAHPFWPTMMPATRDNKNQALALIGNLSLKPYTNVSDAIDNALAEESVTHIFLLSDGEPNTGIDDFMKLRAFTREHNTRHVQINTLALGLGERFKGMRLLRALAEDNDGQYSYINLENDIPQAER